MHLLPIVALALCLAVSPAAQTHTHGGAVGPLDRDSVVFWTRTSDVADVSVRYGLLPDLGDAVETQPVRTAESSDFTAKVTVDGLRADATYYWQTRVAAPDNPMHFELSPIGSFRTPPDPETRRVVRIAFSGDVDVTGNDLCADILRAAPELFVSLGDMPYADGSHSLAQFWSKHREARADPTLQDFFRRLQLAAIWDDHDVINDWDIRVTSSAVQNGMTAWRQYMPVADQRDIYRKVRWGRDVELFLLDCRSYRGNNDAADLPAKTMLGPAQTEWLRNALSASTATFKVVCSSVPLRHGTAGGGVTGNDCWDGYQHNRDAILRHIVEQGITGVVWICADQHWAAAHHHPEGIREYVVGPLSKETRDLPQRADPGLLWIVRERSWGLLSVVPGTPDPVLRVEIHGPDGLLYQDEVEARVPASYAIESGSPDVGFALHGAHRHWSRSAPHCELPGRPPSEFTCSFVPGVDARWRPLPLHFGVGAGEHVWLAGRGEDVPDPAHEVLHADGFDDEFPGTDYHVVDETIVDGPSAWFTSGGQLFQASNIGGFPFDSGPIKPGTFARFGSPTWTDYTVRVRVRSRDDDHVGVLFRCQGPNDFYRFVINREFGFARLEKCVGGQHSVLATNSSFRYEPLAWYELAVVAVGDRLRGYVDGELLVEATDGALHEGNAALYTWSNHLTAFDDLSVRRGDAIAAGVAPLLRETFNDGVPGGFVTSDQGTNEGPGVWQEGASLLVQTSNVWGGDPDPAVLAKPGTVAIFGEASWRAYWFGVKVRNADDDAAGVVFRWVDADNHYRFSWDVERGYRRLAKVVGGQWTLLWADAAPLPHSVWHDVAVEAVGPVLRVFADGHELCSVVDSSHPEGKVGLYSWRSAGVAFDDVVVRQPYVDVASFAARTQSGRVEMLGRAPQGIGAAWIVALSFSRANGIPLALIDPRDPRVLPLDLDPLFVTTLNPFPGLVGFRGFVPPDATIRASIDVPVVAALRGMQAFAGGFTLDLTALRTRDVLPSVPIWFP